MHSTNLGNVNWLQSDRMHVDKIINQEHSQGFFLSFVCNSNEMANPDKHATVITFYAYIF